MSGALVSDSVRVGIVTDEPIRLMGLRCVFEECSESLAADLIPVAGTLEELLDDSDVGYILLDLNSSTKSLATLEIIRRVRPQIRTIVIGPDGDPDLILNVIATGTRAYLASDAGPATVRKAIEAVASGSIWAPRVLLAKLIERLISDLEKHISNGHPRLTARECQVLDLILTASSNREIASRLGIEERTVKAHVGRLMRKTGADNRIELSLRALKGQGIGAPELNERRVAERRTAERRKTKNISGY